MMTRGFAGFSEGHWLGFSLRLRKTGPFSLAKHLLMDRGQVSYGEDDGFPSGYYPAGVAGLQGDSAKRDFLQPAFFLCNSFHDGSGILAQHSFSPQKTGKRVAFSIAVDVSHIPTD